MRRKRLRDLPLDFVTITSSSSSAKAARFGSRLRHMSRGHLRSPFWPRVYRVWLGRARRNDGMLKNDPDRGEEITHFAHVGLLGDGRDECRYTPQSQF